MTHVTRAQLFKPWQMQNRARHVVNLLVLVMHMHIDRKLYPSEASYFNKEWGRLF